MSSTAARIEGLTQARTARVRNLFEPEAVIEVNSRLSRLTPASEGQWGEMNPAQMLAHCSAGLEMAMGRIVESRVLLGRILGPFAKRSIIEEGKPIRRNAPTAKCCVVTGERDFEVELKQLRASIDGFVAGGTAGCAKQPHWFFGPLNPTEWAVLMHQHLDHHLRQFGV